MKKYILNDRIRAREVRLIDDEGNQVGVVPIDKAKELADSKNLDLLLVSDTATPPVCKIVDYGQFKYQQRKKDKLAKKSGKAQVTKELKLSPKISDHDFMVRVNRGREFLNKRFKVKVTVAFRGREIVHPELGQAVLQRFVDLVEEVGVLDGKFVKSNRSLIAIINPKGK